jgi:DNA-binding transcriptional LysR family regulator
MSIRYLRTLVAVADYRTFGAAGEVIGVTQSAVSMQMKALEFEMRLNLFDRTKRPPVLNTAGDELVLKARAARIK